MHTKFSSWNINRYFKVSLQLKNTQGLMEAGKDYLNEIFEYNEKIKKSLMQKHNTTDRRKAYKLEIAELKKRFKPSKEAYEYLEQLNENYKGKILKFYYTDPILNYCSIDDPDCEGIPIYKVLCDEIKFIEDEKLPMIITKDKNYSLVNIVDIIVEKGGFDS